MSNSNSFDDCTNSLGEQNPLNSSTIKEMFSHWMAKRNINKYPIKILVSCIDYVSELAIKNKNSTISFWEYYDKQEFESKYFDFLKTDVFKKTRINTHEVLISAGVLYSRFLSKLGINQIISTTTDPKIVKQNNNNQKLKEDKLESNDLVLKEGKLESNDPEIKEDKSKSNDFDAIIAWLVTQKNEQGLFYLENSVKQYFYALNSIIKRVKFPPDMEGKNIFMCRTPEELSAFGEIIKSSQEYKNLNRTALKMFLLGMNFFMKYLHHLNDSVTKLNSHEDHDITRVLTELNLRYVDKRQSGGAIWVLGGMELSSTMEKLSNLGIDFIFKKGGAKSTIYRDAWWCRENKKPIDSLINTNLVLNQVAAARVADEERKTTQTILNQINDTHVVIQESDTNQEVIRELKELITNYFPRGFRINSAIELTRLKNIYSEKFNNGIDIADESFKKLIQECGILYNEKIFIIDPQIKERIKNNVVKYFNDGAQIIFFSEFYLKNESWLFDANVVSEELLVDILRELFPKLMYTLTYFGYTTKPIPSVVEREVLRVWGDDLLNSYEQLAERLEYVPIERIKITFGQNENFIWNKNETFLHISRINIDEETRRMVSNTAERECENHGYVSMASLPLDVIYNQYYQLSTSAVQNIIYRICLSDKFDKKGKILIRKGDSLDALKIINEYCRSLEKCSLKTLFNYEKELTGENYRWISLEAANTVMVRIDEDTFVADKFVHFDIEMIDTRINMIMKGDYVPLKSFTTFGAFPDCGQQWNLFLLESYCRRFSNLFRFDAQSMNSSNSGAIIRRSCSLTYMDILVDAVVNSRIMLTGSQVGKFLQDSGYISRRTSSRINSIIAKAEILRKRKN